MGVKRLLSGLVLLLVAIAIVGCGDDEKSDKSGATGPTATQTLPDATAATGATGSDDDAGSKADDRNGASKTDGGKTDDQGKGTDADEKPRGPVTSIGISNVKFLVNDKLFVGDVLRNGRFAGKPGREVAPETTIILSLTVFDRGNVKIRVKSPNGKTRIYVARKLKRLAAIREGDFYELRIVGSGSRAYIQAKSQPRVVGPAG